jgi:hypothetical protein
VSCSVSTTRSSVLPGDTCQKKITCLGRRKANHVQALALRHHHSTCRAALRYDQRLTSKISLNTSCKSAVVPPADSTGAKACFNRVSALA